MASTPIVWGARHCSSKSRGGKGAPAKNTWWSPRASRAVMSPHQLRDRSARIELKGGSKRRDGTSVYFYVTKKERC